MMVSRRPIICNALEMEWNSHTFFCRRDDPNTDPIWSMLGISELKMDTSGFVQVGKKFIKIFCNRAKNKNLAGQFGIGVLVIGFSRIRALKNMPGSSLVEVDVNMISQWLSVCVGTFLLHTYVYAQVFFKVYMCPVNYTLTSLPTWNQTQCYTLKIGFLDSLLYNVDIYN